MYAGSRYNVKLKTKKMKRIILTITVLSALLSACSDNGNQVESGDAEEVEIVETIETVTYNKIASESAVEWRASHLGGVQPRYGTLSVKSAEFLVNDEVLTNGTVVMDMTSISVESFEAGDEQKGKLEGHLLSADFFNTEMYPTATFELTNITDATGDFTSEVTGNLTILDISKSITFKADVAVSDSEVSINSEDFAIDRSDWGLTYNAEGTEGVPVDYLIANDIGFTIDVTLTK